MRLPCSGFMIDQLQDRGHDSSCSCVVEFSRVLLAFEVSSGVLLSVVMRLACPSRHVESSSLGGLPQLSEIRRGGDDGLVACVSVHGPPHTHVGLPFHPSPRLMTSGRSSARRLVGLPARSLTTHCRPHSSS